MWSPAHNMRILFVSHTTDKTSGGWGRYTHDLIVALREQGHEVQNINDVLGVQERLGDPLKYLLNPLRIFFDIGKARRAIETFKPDIVHITVEPYALLMPFIKTSMPVVLTVHGSYAYVPAVSSSMLRPLYSVLYARALTRVARVIAVSQYTKNYFLTCMEAADSLFPEDRVNVVHNGVSTQGVTFIEKTEQKEKKTILTVAPARGRKGIAESLRAVAYYKEIYHTPVEYRIVGSRDASSAYRTLISEEIKRLGLSNTVVFTGRVSEEQLNKEYASADVFLMLPIVRTPYFEGFGLVYLEANARGVPVIGSSIGGSAEAIEDGVSGYAVDPKNAEAVAEALHNILDNASIDRAKARDWANEHTSVLSAERIAYIYSHVSRH